jgi:prepilin-type N-terminal cleavage/methylation domain-containing protein
MGKNGLSLLEILVSIIILAMLVVGLTQVFISARKFAIRSRSRMAAAQMSKVFLDYLQMHVNVTNWDSAGNDLTSGLRYCGGSGSPQQSECLPVADRILDNTTYNATYNITTDPARFGLLRQVALNITWNETTLY